MNLPDPPLAAESRRVEVIHLQYSFILPDHPGSGRLGLVLAHPWQLETLEVITSRIAELRAAQTASDLRAFLPDRLRPTLSARPVRGPEWFASSWEEMGLGKMRKSITTRKPPVPSDNYTEIADWITRGVMPDMHPIVERLDESIRETIPRLRYAIKWKNAFYGVPELGWIIQMAAYAVSVNVIFLGGADFDPPPPLGATDRSRYVKLTTLEEAQGPEMQKWIEQAGRMPGWK